jgi:hypothetical protein
VSLNDPRQRELVVSIGWDAEAARHVPLDRLCLSPQCGFSSMFEGNALTEDEQRAKLRLIVETAAEVRGVGARRSGCRPAFEEPRDGGLWAGPARRPAAPAGAHHDGQAMPGHWQARPDTGRHDRTLAGTR